jgi:hypothetical protein
VTDMIPTNYGAFLDSYRSAFAPPWPAARRSSHQPRTHRAVLGRRSGHPCPLRAWQ